MWRESWSGIRKKLKVYPWSTGNKLGKGQLRLLTRQFSYQLQKPTYSPTQYCVWETCPFGAMVEYHPISAKDLSRLHQSGKKVLPGIFLGHVLYAEGIWKWWQTLRNWKRWTHLKSMQKVSMQRKCERSKMVKKNHIPDRRWNSKTLWKRSSSENIHLDPGQPRPRRRTRKSSRRIQTGLLHPHFKTHRRIMEKPEVHLRELHLPSSRWTESQTVRAERSIIPNSTEISWRDQGLQVRHCM